MVSLVLHGMRSIMVFAEVVLTRIALTCGVVTFACAALACIAVGLKIAGNASPGWVTTAVGMLILIAGQTAVLTSVLLLMTGIMKAGPEVTTRDACLRYIRSIESTEHDA
jgi:hypothetical protein